MKLLLVFMLAAISVMAADVTGTWTGILTVASHAADSGEGPAFLVLKQDGEKVTGTGGQSETNQRPIQNGKIENGSLTFEIQLSGGVLKFNLKNDGDSIKGDVVGKRGDETMTGSLAVTRKK